MGLDDGSIDVTLEVWPSGHAADYETYITGKQSVVDLGLLGPEAKIGWYVPKFIVDEHPELATWEGFEDPELAKLFATSETGDLGQFLMGDPSYVTYDEQIIANLKMPLKYVVAGSEAALLTGIDQAIARGLAYAPYADMVWCETAKPDLDEARKFAEAIKAKFPDRILAYNCSPSFNWKKKLDDATIARFQRELGAMGYKFQFITLAGFHSLNYSMFELAHGYARNNMTAFVELQQKEFAAAEKGFTAVKHQREVGTGYFDAVTTTIEAQASTAALKGSTEDEQFFDAKHG